MTTIATIGLGAVVRHIHIPAYSQLSSEVRVIAGCDPDASAREYARSKWGIEVYADAGEMLEKNRPDVVAVCTPPQCHREHAGLAIERGCHVFLEKPLAENLDQADDIIAAADRA